MSRRIGWIQGQAHLRYQIVICHTGGEAWNKAVGIIAELSTEEVPEAVDPVAYHTAVAQSYHHVYQTTEDAGTKQKVIEACEAGPAFEQEGKRDFKAACVVSG